MGAAVAAVAAPNRRHPTAAGGGYGKPSAGPVAYQGRFGTAPVRQRESNRDEDDGDGEDSYGWLPEALRAEKESVVFSLPLSLPTNVILEAADMQVGSKTECAEAFLFTPLSFALTENGLQTLHDGSESKKQNREQYQMYIPNKLPADASLSLSSSKRHKS